MKNAYHAVELPAIVSGDWHIHSRAGKVRLQELAVLCVKINELREHTAAKSLVIVGDILDRNAPLAVDTIMEMAALFLRFSQVWIVIGNHDTPVRATKLTPLDLFELCGCKIIKEFTQVDNSVFMPYYTQVPDTNMFGTSYVFAHKDVLNLNNYADTEWAVSMSQFPACKYTFNGHLHTYQQFSLPNGGMYVQCGAPYPCTWGDKWENNRYLHVVNTDGNHIPYYTNITGDAGADAGVCTITRSKDSTVGEDSCEYSQQHIMASLQSIKDERASLEEVLQMADIPSDISPIIRSVVRDAVAKIDAIRF